MQSFVFKSKKHFKFLFCSKTTVPAMNEKGLAKKISVISVVRDK